MDKDILKGIKISFGFVLFLVTILSLSYAGYHGANQVISGTFLGNYIFQNNVTFQNDVNFTDANIIGLSANSLPDCSVDEIIVKSDSEWICKKETLVGKEKVNISSYESDIIISGNLINLSKIYDESMDSFAIATLTQRTTFSSHTCGYPYPSSISEEISTIIFDFGNNYSSKFGNFMMSGDLEVIGGSTIQYYDDHVPNAYCNILHRAGGTTMYLRIYTSVDGTNWVQQGNTINANYVNQNNIFSIMGTISGQYVKIYVERVIPSGVKYGSEVKLKIKDLKIYYNLF